MSIRKWHVGKLVILWAWGGTVAALVLAEFESTSVISSPLLHLCELMFVLAIALVLSVVTWIWLGDRKTETEPAVQSAKETADS